MPAPLIVSIPHGLGKQEATRRLQAGLGSARANFAHLLSVDEETWNGDNLKFRVRALGQAADGNITVYEDRVYLEVTLPWLLAKLAERIVPTIRKEGTLMLEKK